MDKWHQRAAEWKCAPEAVPESGDEKDEELGSSDEEDDILEGTEEDAMENPAEYIQDLPLEPEEIEMVDSSTNTECIFVQTKAHHRGSSSKTISLTKGSIVIKRSQTFSPSAVVNKNEYVCRVSLLHGCMNSSKIMMGQKKSGTRNSVNSYSSWLM